MKNIILIYGNEEYLKEKKKKELLKALNAEGSINFNSFSDENLDLLEIRRLIDTVPLFEEYRKILISDSGLFKKTSANLQEGQETEDEAVMTSAEESFSDNGEGNKDRAAGGAESVDASSGNRAKSLGDAYDPTEVFSDIPETAVVIFVENNVSQASPMFKLVKKQGEIFKFETVETKRGQERRISETEVRNWAAGMFKAAGRRIDGPVLNYMIQLAGYDMENLSGEIEKLISYMLDKSEKQKISIDDVNAICSKTLSDRVFVMLESRMKGRTGEALAMLEELFALKVPPMKTLYLLTRHYNQALAVRECQDARMSDAQICAKTEMKDWQLRRIKEQTAGISAGEIRAALENCADMEYKIKRGNMSERIALEVLML